MSKHKTDVLGLPSLAVPAEVDQCSRNVRGVAAIAASSPPAKVENGTVEAE